jgi:hypothetical protein
MNCPICGSESAVIGVSHRPLEYCVEYARICDRKHRFSTMEVHLSLLGDKREFDCAVRHIKRRIGRYNRDLMISMDQRPASLVAKDLGITATRVRQIRASPLDASPHRRVAKIDLNLERNNHEGNTNQHNARSSGASDLHQVNSADDVAGVDG